MNKYIIENNMVGIRKTKIEDLEYVMKAETHDENKPFVGQWEYEKHVESLKDENIFHIIIEDYENKKPIGYAILAGFKNMNKSLELIRIVIDDKGNGFGKETLKLIKELAFEKNDFNRLWLDVRLKNERAQHVYKRVGFIEEGILREAVLVEGRYESLKLMAILKKDYLSSI